MFGYVTPLKAELKVREYDVFKAYYCGLCREIGERSYISKMTLTYDMTVLALLLSSVYLDRVGTEKSFCPFKMSKVEMVSKNPFLEYAAEMNILLSNRKLVDNYNDDRSYAALVASKIIKLNKYRTTSKEKIERIDYYLKEINRLEKSKCDSIDEIGGCFGEVTGEIFAVYDDNNTKMLKFIGVNIGKWIYTLDAYDDLIDDIKSNSYNPLIYRFQYNNEGPDEFKTRIKDNIQFVLIKCLDEISKAFELLNIKKNKGLIENIIYLGMERKTSSVLEGSCCNEKSIRSIRNKRRCFTGGSETGI
jgi:hypothetical protein